MSKSYLYDSIELIIFFSGVETAVGVVDVNSSPVYFHVQRSEPYSLVNTTIPFNIEQLNVGGGMHIDSGIFTAPKSGIYFFSFTGIKESSANQLRVHLYHNSNYITVAYGAAVSGHLAMTLSSTLSLKSDDQVSLLLFAGQLHDAFYNHTNFNGLLLQEEMFS
jgi:C1q-related factor